MIQEIPLDKLRLLKHNPRRITQEQMGKLIKSIQDDPEFLQKRPVLVNLVEGVYEVYAGNQRVSAARKLGWKTIPCIVDENLPEEIVKQRIIKDNKAAGTWDYDCLANEFEAHDLLEWGFTLEELHIDLPDIDDEKEEKEKKKKICPHCGEIL